MPRRSTRQKKSRNDEAETVSDIATDTKPSATNSAVESVSKENQSQKTDVQPADEKSESTEAATAVAVEKTKDDDDSDDEFIDDRESSTLATTRSRRARTQRVSYKDESSSEEEESEDEDSEDDNPLFAGLNKAQRAAMKAKMAGLQKSSETAASKEREQSIEEIISSFEFNIGEKVTKKEAGFAFDFCRKHQVDINDKIEEEGDFFLINIREMMEEKALQLKAQGASGAASKKKKSKNSNDSDSEFDMNEYGDDSDSAYDEDDSDWENSDIDHENLLSEDEDDGGKKKKKRRRKNVFRADGKQYFAKGRLLLNDALKDTTNFEGWSAARVQAWKNKEVNPNAYYYRFNNPGVPAKNGRIGAEVAEHELFMRRIVELGVNMHWGKFSMKIPGRVGYQCSNYWRQMMKDCWVKDPNYWIRADGSFQFKRAKKGSIPDAIRKYSFVVLKDPSKVFAPLPGVHPKRPSDAALAKYLQKECKTLSEKEKAGGKRSAPKKRSTKNSTKSAAAGESEKDSEELRKAKDNAPKKPQTAYFLFTATVREELKKSDPTLKVTQIAKESGKRWRALGAEEKKGFTERAAIAKKEYTAAMDAYLASEEGKWLLEDQKRAEEEKKAKKANKKKDGAPKKPQTAYFLYLASVREDIKKEFGVSKASDVAKEAGKKWKALGEEEKKPFADEAAQLKKEYQLKLAEFKEAEANKKAAEAETEAETAVESDKTKTDAEIATETDATKEAEVEKVEKEKETVSEAEAESESAKPKKKGKKGKAKGKGKGRGKKRKHDGISDDLEPAQKKRKLSEEGDAEGADDGPMSVLANVMDLITGERVTKPAMSPYGHVMEYDSWCSILRNPKTKNKCPFTQQPMTRRQLIKLDEHNIEQYQAQIVNLTADDMQKLSA